MLVGQVELLNLEVNYSSMDTAVWILSKAIWMLVDPKNGLLILLVLGATLLYTGYKSLGRKLVTLVSGILLLLSIFPWAGLMLLPLENRFPIPEPLPNTIDGIIVLGGSEHARITQARGQVALLDSAERLTAFVSLSRRYPEAKLVFAGGAGGLRDQEFKGADTAKILFKQLGIKPNRVQFESNSRNTFENAMNAFELAKPKKQESWVLVTSAWHMPRAVGVFRNAGWSVIPYPVDFSTSGKMDFRIGFYGLSVSSVSWVLREWIGMVSYWLMGKTSDLFPKPL